MGTRNQFKNKAVITMDHPHAYGDKYVSRQAVQRPPGSSPRVWGQEYRFTMANNAGGIIPTRMGTRVDKANKLAVGGDHPHAYGDKR